MCSVILEMVSDDYFNFFETSLVVIVLSAIKIMYGMLLVDFMQGRCISGWISI